MTFRIDNPLSEEQWQAIDNAALRILQKTGIIVPHDRVVELLSRQGGISGDGTTVRFDSKLVRENMQAMKGCEEYDTHLITGAYSHNFMDPDTCEVRSASLEDLVQSTR